MYSIILPSRSEPQSPSSTPTTPTSEASTKIGSESTSMMLSHYEEKSFRRRAFERAQDAATSRDVLLFLVAFRILNALSIRTFFQPDEYFQSLEPAWQMAFGADSGAWITWEWKHRLRSAIHPAIFAGVYWLSSFTSEALQLSPAYHAELMITAPKILQAVFAALGDYYTWKLGERIYGRGSNEAWAALALTVCSPWQWFCSTRTMSNCLETTLTIMALHSWPWHWSMAPTGKEKLDDSGLRIDESQGSWHPGKKTHELAGLRRSLLLAAMACVLRPTNLLIWICLTCLSWFCPGTRGRLVPFRWFRAVIWMHISLPSFARATRRERVVLIREATIYGSVILAVSALIDRAYYQTWTFPPFRFLYFNVAQSLAIFYGRNDWHYYLSQGYPLLLTTFLPFALIGIFQSLFTTPPPPTSSCAPPFAATIKSQLATTSLFVPTILSLISHKEVRFIYPLLPALHLLASTPFTSFFLPAISPVSPTRRTPSATIKRTILLPLLLALNILVAIFTTTLHQTAPLAAVTYLRTQHESHYLTQPPSFSHIAQADTTMTVGFLMPCHSTPWRSHLVHPGIKAWALSCEPPVNLNASATAAYVDEADRFYADPAGFLMREMGRPPRKRSGFGGVPPKQGLGLANRQDDEFGEGGGAWDGQPGRKRWPEYLVFFEQAEATMRVVLRDSGYAERWRGWNSWLHDDWRRRGDVVVWCLRDRDWRKDALGGKKTGFQS